MYYIIQPEIYTNPGEYTPDIYTWTTKNSHLIRLLPVQAAHRYGCAGTGCSTGVLFCWACCFFLDSGAGLTDRRRRKYPWQVPQLGEISRKHEASARCWLNAGPMYRVLSRCIHHILWTLSLKYCLDTWAIFAKIFISKKSAPYTGLACTHTYFGPVISYNHTGLIAHWDALYIHRLSQKMMDTHEFFRGSSFNLQGGGFYK